MTLNVDGLIQKLEEANNQIRAAQQEKKLLEDKLSEAISDEVKAQLADKDYGCGTANINTGKYKVKVVVGKKVKWDENQLGSIYREIQSSGHNPDEYIKTTYSVSEASYKAWPSTIKQTFEPARTVEPGKPVITFEGV